jgi:Skp family chaperone for outer membrane proteins
MNICHVDLRAVLMILLLALAPVACDKEKGEAAGPVDEAAKQAPVQAEEVAALSDEDLDAERGRAQQEAQSTITADNLEDELAALEAQLDEDDEDDEGDEE